MAMSELYIEKDVLSASYMDIDSRVSTIGLCLLVAME